MSSPSVVFTNKDHIGRITLNRPEGGNIVTRQMAQELDIACTQVNQDDDIYVVVLTGTGKAFCTGIEQDLKSDSVIVNASEAIAGISQPVIAAINGDTLGVGLELALACDIRLAAEGARFGMPQVTQGLIPAHGGTQRLPRIVGKGKALEMLLTGDTVDATAAQDMGLVHKVVAFDKLAEEAEEMAKSIAARAPIALKYVKEAVNKGLDLTLEQGLRLEADIYFLLHTTEDRTEGIRAFQQKRTPDFKGR